MQKLLGHGPAFFEAHRLQSIERLLKDALDHRPFFLHAEATDGRVRHDAGQGQDLSQQRLTAIREAHLFAHAPHLFDVRTERDGVDLKVVGGVFALAAQVNLEGAAAHGLADHLLELGFQEVVRLGGAKPP